MVSEIAFRELEIIQQIPLQNTKFTIQVVVIEKKDIPRSVLSTFSDFDGLPDRSVINLSVLLSMILYSTQSQAQISPPPIIYLRE